ncbi:winged helix-turn-helix domain-containing protein [Asanoa siamensis]|uniref:Transposase n=1 Tax=Asanoa siamensis TaxID=926357 RepID=A0ABQ4CWT1_9ACTN|nr:winged helix-turn-helix domain-containing protein [Asanoa siamensis]GIF75739.1 hypothetical protein Asi02nite_52570 [Asanoa siamensis]
MGALLDPRGSALSWCRRERIGGDGALAAGPRASGGFCLTRAQELALIEAIRAGRPADHALAGPLWTRRSVVGLAGSLLGVTLSSARATRLLASWGAGFRPPSSRACPLCAAPVARWVETAFPAIARKAATHRSEPHWIGRSRLYGVTPAADVVCAVTGPSGRQRLSFVIAPGGPSATLRTDFLLGLNPTRPVHAVVDGSWATWQLPRRLPPRVVLHAMPSCERR